MIRATRRVECRVTASDIMMKLYTHNPWQHKMFGIVDGRNRSLPRKQNATNRKLIKRPN